jgi:AcrR family transcriptional regulator
VYRWFEAIGRIWKARRLGQVQANVETRKREEDLISVASAHLNTMGVSVEWFGEIAATLGITRPALYNYVRERSDLQYKCYIQACDVLDAALNRATRSRDPETTISTFLSLTATGEGPEIAALCEIDALPLEKQEAIRDRRDQIVSRIATVIEFGIGRGRFRPVDSIIIANAIVGMANWTALERRWGAKQNLVLRAAGIGEILFRGIAFDQTVSLHKPDRFARPRSANIDPFDRRSLENAKREAILVAASGLFNRRGVGATRVEDVAAMLDLNKRTIYHLVGQKQAMVEACVDRAYGFYLNAMDAAEKLSCSRLEAMFGALRDVIETANDPESAVLVPYVGFGQLAPAGRKKATAYARRLFDGYERILIAGEVERSIRRLPHDQILPGLPGVFSWVSNLGVMPSHERARVADELATLAIYGLRA